MSAPNPDLPLPVAGSRVSPRPVSRAFVSPSPLPTRSATALARSIRTRAHSSTEVVEAHLARIERAAPSVNAVVTLDAAAARERARAADRALERGEPWGPLHGLPVTVKDQFSTAGLRTTYGLPHYASFVPEADAPLVRRLREAGAILLGKTNLPLAAYDWQCTHPTFGRTNNPRDLSRTPGGSSGGSAAALAAGLAPLELGADVAGSIRVPSHFCGVAGLRPTEGVLPLDGITPPGRPRTVRHIAVPGPMARTVADLQLGWRALRGPHAPDAFPDVAPADLRVAVTPALGGVPVDTDTQRTLRRAADALADAGCKVERRDYPVDAEAALATWGLVQGYELTAGLPGPFRVPPLRTLVWRGLVRHKYGFLADHMAEGARLSARDYLKALGRRTRLARRLDAALPPGTLWLTPVASIPAFTHRRTGADLAIEGAPVPYALPLAVYNCATAVTGHPILTLPAGRSGEGLPIGLQVHARRGADPFLLAAGQCLEAILDAPSAPVPLEG